MVKVMMKEHFSTAIQASYDSPVDVLHLVRDFVPYEGDGLPGGVELDFSLTDGAPCGVKIIGFHRNGWDRNAAQLAKIVGGHLREDENAISRLINQAVYQRAV